MPRVSAFPWMIASLVGVFVHAAQAQTSTPYPNRPVRVVVPFAAGGANDLAIRLVGDRLHKALGQPFVVEHRPGANGNVAAAAVERAPADGYTLLMGNLGLMVHNPVIYPKPGFEVANFAALACIAEAVMVVKVPAESPHKSLRELVAAAQASPGKLNYASVGSGSALHLGTELLMNRLGFTAVQIPFNGGGPMINAVINGSVDFVVDPLVYGGNRVRPLAVLDARRKSGLPEVPTIEEAGFPRVNANSWIGLFAPKAMPPAIAEALGAQVVSAVGDGAVREGLTKAGLEPCIAGPAAFAERIRASEQLWLPLLGRLNVKVE